MVDDTHRKNFKLKLVGTNRGLRSVPKKSESEH